jgi:hypothetical protein
VSNPSHADFGQAILDADALLCGDPDVLAQAAAAARRSMPVGQRDQAQATLAATRQLVNDLAESIGKSALKTQFAAWPAWARLGGIGALCNWLSGETRTCGHAPTPKRPGPIVAAAWMPGIVCPLCAELLTFPPGSVKDRTCDGCGHECAKPGVGGGRRPDLPRGLRAGTAHLHGRRVHVLQGRHPEGCAMNSTAGKPDPFQEQIRILKLSRTQLTVLALADEGLVRCHYTTGAYLADRAERPVVTGTAHSLSSRRLIKHGEPDKDGWIPVLATVAGRHHLNADYAARGVIAVVDGNEIKGEC